MDDLCSWIKQNTQVISTGDMNTEYVPVDKLLEFLTGLSDDGQSIPEGCHEVHSERLTVKLHRKVTHHLH